MKKCIILFLILFVNLNLFPHPWKPGHYVIIDTDGGIDDIRAICLMLASPDVRILAVITSSGVLSADNAYRKVKSLMNSFYHEGLPVGINRESGFQSQNFSTALQSKWGDEEGIDPAGAPDYRQLISEIMTAEKTRISFVCLGGMTTVSRLYREDPGFRKWVKEIIWSADGLKDIRGFNYNIDSKAASYILGQDIPVRIVKGSGQESFYDQDLLKQISEVNNTYARKISRFFRSGEADQHSYSFTAHDEMTGIYLHYPQLFKADSVGNKSENRPAEKGIIPENFMKILKGQTVARNQVFKEFPEQPSFYFTDVEPDVTEIIARHGIDEWSSGVIACELHRHLGVFAIIGVKMGIRAREYFCTGVDEFRLTSFAGSVPPLSCMNDGLQVSTGATPGHGLLTVSSDSVTRPVAEFSYLNHKVRFILKPEIAKIISSELREISFVYDLDSNIYWELVRKNTIKYWLNLDRHDIFTIEEIR